MRAGPILQRQRFVCNWCGAELTGTVTVADTSRYIVNHRRSWNWGEPFFAGGLAIRERGQILDRYAGCWLVQPGDTTGMALTLLVRRTTGCCGAHVASTETDCSVPQFIALHQEAVRAERVRERA